MDENLKALFLLLMSIAALFLMVIYGFNTMAYTIHRFNFEQNRLNYGMPYYYEELTQCSGGIYSGLAEYKEFFVHSNPFGDDILSKKEYYVISKRKAEHLLGIPSWEKEDPIYYYCLGKLKKGD